VQLYLHIETIVSCSREYVVYGWPEIRIPDFPYMKQARRKDNDDPHEVKSSTDSSFKHV